jgi:hypothetical protein
VTGLTEVGAAPAEPRGNRAAEFALELDKVSAVLRAVLDAGADTNRRTLPADQILRIVVTLHLARLVVEQHATKVG